MYINILMTQNVLKEYLLLKAGIYNFFYPSNWNPILVMDSMCMRNTYLLSVCVAAYMCVYENIYISVNV